MRAIVYRGVNDLRLETVPTPQIRPDEVLVRVAACGVCPTDIKKIQQGLLSPPRIYGHETAGQIVALGSRVRGWRLGARVAVHHHVPCLKCHFCERRAFAQCPEYKKTGATAGFEPAGGGYSEFVRVLPGCLPGLVRIPRGNEWIEGAMLEPVNTVLKAVEMLRLRDADTVLVIGQGPIGLMFNRLAVLAGARVIGADLLPVRLRLGLQFGAFQALAGDDPNLPDRVRAATGGRGADAAIVTAPGDAPVALAQASVRGGGAVMLFAQTVRGRPTPVDLATVCVDEKALLGSYSSDFTLQRRVARLVFSRAIDVRPLVTHFFPLEATADAVALAARPTPESLKIVVSPNPGETAPASPPEGHAEVQQSRSAARRRVSP